MTDSVQAFLKRARQFPNSCAWCGGPKQQVIRLVTLNAPATKVDVDQDIPTCKRCLQRYMDFAGNEAVMVKGGGK